MNILLIAGEVSGDLYASHLAKAIKDSQTSVNIFGIGGDRLKQECDTFIFEAAYKHQVGVQNIFSKMKLKKELMHSLKELCDNKKIDKAIILDFQHMNGPISALLQSKHIPIYTFITPNFWMWRDKKQAQRICDYSEKVFCIFKKEYDFYKSISPKARYFGHPLTDLVNAKETKTDRAHKKICFLPGSRVQEFHLYADEMLRTARLLKEQKPNCEIVFSLDSRHHDDLFQEKLKPFPDFKDAVSYGETQAHIHDSDLVIACSGSVTLEVVLAKKHLIVLAALPYLTYLYARHVLGLKVDYVSLPNFLTDQQIVPEFMQKRIKAADVCASALQVLAQTSAPNYKLVLNEIVKEEQVFKAVADDIFMP